jgi:MFS family permease
MTDRTRSSRSTGDALATRWVVAGVSATVNSLAWSVRSTFALFYVALLAEFGWGRGEAALGYSLSWLFLLAFSPIAGWLYDRAGARLAVSLGGLVLGTALALTGRVTALWQYYLVFGALGAAGIALIMMPAAAIVSRWFAEGRGRALGLISAGASASAVVFYPLNTWLLAHLGWRTAFAVYGAIVAVAVIVPAVVLYREPDEADRPHGAGGLDAGSGPVGERPGSGAATARGADTGPGEWTFAAALRSHRFWAVFAMWALGVIGYQILTTHQVAHAAGRGLEAVTLAWVFALTGACTVAGNLLGGALSDRWGREGVFTLGTAIGIAGIAGLAGVRGPQDLWMLLAYAVSGVGFGMRISLLTAIPADIFHGRHLGAILGAANGGGGLGGFVGPFLGGWIFDVTGSYAIAFAAAALAVAGSAAAAWIAAPRTARR